MRGANGEDAEIQRPTFVIDLDNIATGWLLFREGQAPERVMDPSLDQPAPSPGEGFKRGFVVATFSPKFFGGVAEFASASIHLANAIKDVYAQYEAEKANHRGQLPVIACTGSEAMKDRYGTNYRPTFQIVQWVERPKELPNQSPVDAADVWSGAMARRRPRPRLLPSTCRRRRRSLPPIRSPKRCSDRIAGGLRPSGPLPRMRPMNMSNVAPMIEPDAAMMRRHVGHLFEGWLDGCHDGRIELAWTDGRDGKLKHAAIFGTDELDELVERALAENRKPGQNVYIGQALRHPDIAPFGRCKDDEFFALTAFYADIDDDVVLRRPRPSTAIWAACRPPWSSPAAIRIRGRRCCGGSVRRCAMRILPPAEPGDRPGARRRHLRHQSSRVLRLGGSIAWPRKEGRIVERTELLLPRRRTAEELICPSRSRRRFRRRAGTVVAGRERRCCDAADRSASICTRTADTVRSARPICRSRPALRASAPATTGTTTWSGSPVTGSRAAGPMPRS